MINKLTLASIFLMVALNLFAQFDSKFGKVSKEELELKECSFDSSANSMILSQTGNLWFYYNDVKEGWQFKVEITKRIKVFNKLDKDIANVSINLYAPENSEDEETIFNLKGFTYNLVDGKIEKTKLTNSEEYTTRLSDYRVETSFAMPDVREGSVIEYKYTLISDYISNLYPWHFQTKLPVAYSEFRAMIPEFFNYHNSQLGNHANLEIEQKTQNETFKSLESISKVTTFIGRNIPALEDEPYMNNKSDMPTRLEYQLISIQMPHKPIKQIASNYDEFNKTLMSWESMGKTLNRGNFSKDLIESFASSGDELATDIYDHLNNHFTWNKVYNYSNSNAGRKAYNDATANVAGINLTLVAVLREAGFTSNPVLLSTRGNGTPHPIYPNYEGFNYVIAAVQLENGIAFLDATSKLPFGVLPVRCLNGKGWMVSENGGKWLNLSQGTEHSSSVLITINIGEEGFETDHQIKYTGYAAINENADYESVNESEYIESIASNFTETQIEDLTFEHQNNEVKTTFKAIKESEIEEIIYLDALQFGVIKSNPFKRESRQSLVDFAYPISKTVMARVVVPEGYNAELPEGAIVSLPNGGGKFTYSANQVGNTISIISKFNLNQTTFTTQEYTYLRQFYDFVAKKNNEMIVLKSI